MTNIELDEVGHAGLVLDPDAISILVDPVTDVDEDVTSAGIRKWAKRHKKQRPPQPL